MRVSQNARFRQTVSRPEGDKHPPGAWLAGLLAEHVAARGWHVLESGNWRDNGWYLSTEHAASRLNVIVAPVGMAEWMIQIAPLYVPGILARLFGGRPSASPQSVFELAKEVHAMLSQAGSFENILYGAGMAIRMRIPHANRLPADTGPTMSSRCPVCGGLCTGLSCPSCGPRRHVPLHEIILGDVEYASEDFLHSWFNLRRYEDHGTLVVYDDDFVFSGKRGDIYFSADSGFELVGPLVPRSTLVGVVGGIALIFAMAWFGVLNVFTLDNPLLYVLVAVLGLLAMATAPVYWIKVRYRGEDGKVRNAYLAASGLFGSTKRVFKRLRQLMTDENPCA